MCLHKTSYLTSFFSEKHVRDFNLVQLSNLGSPSPFFSAEIQPQAANDYAGPLCYRTEVDVVNRLYICKISYTDILSLDTGRSLQEVQHLLLSLSQRKVNKRCSLKPNRLTRFRIGTNRNQKQGFIEFKFCKQTVLGPSTF